MIIEKQNIIKSSIINNNINNNDIRQNLVPIVDFLVDQPVFFPFNMISSAKIIKVRRDILSDLENIKKNLNIHGIPFACELIIPTINNKNLSDFARVGLEIKLFSKFTLNKESSYDNDDYFVGPSNHFNKLNVYGLVRRNEPLEFPEYKPIKKIYEIYDIRETEGKKPPNIKKVFKKFVNITQIFKDFGFIQAAPDQLFFNKSIVENSGWNIFQKHSIIKVGSTYKDLLETVYNKTSDGIWSDKERYWNGEKYNE